MPIIINATKTTKSIEGNTAYEKAKANYKETIEKIRSL